MGSKNCPETPRQKMIGMMYLFLTAMLALNVSSDILAGFTLVDGSLRKSTSSAVVRNNAIYNDFKDLYDQNPTKVGEWLAKAQDVKKRSDELYSFIDDMKLRIVKVADGKKADINNIDGRDNLDASGQIAIVQGRGKMLKENIEKYAIDLEEYVKGDTAKLNMIKKTFATGPIYNAKEKENKPWVYGMFEMMPVAASVTMLSKIQNDIRNAEAEVVQYLKGQVDAGDLRVNKVEALVIPESKYVIQGGTYKAQIVLAASDSTQTPDITVGGASIKDGKYERGCGSIGAFNYNGYIRLKKKDGSILVREFKAEYTVGAPAVTISADLMNVFYAGFDNLVSISVPGIASANLNATTTNGTLRRQGNAWVLRPTTIGVNCVITVTAKMEGGKVQTMGSKQFRVKQLPPPTAFIKYNNNGSILKYKGGKPIAKADLLNQQGLIAEYDDADLDVKFNVTKFDLNITNPLGTTIESSNSASFTQPQINYIRTLAKGKKFFISNIHVIGPDGKDRLLSPIEVIVN